MKFQQLIILGLILSVSLAVTPGRYTNCKNYKSNCATECQQGAWEGSNQIPNLCRVSDCDQLVPVKSDEWCYSCDATHTHSNLSNTQCVKSNCGASWNYYTQTQVWCNDCQPINKFLSYDANSCIASNCYITPSPGAFTTQWCNDCSSTYKFQSGDQKSCVATDCTILPSSNDQAKQWCSDCASSTSKVSCTSQQTNSSTLLLSMATPLIILLINLF